MKKWSNLRNTEAGRYKLSTMVFAIALAGMILWQGVFAMLGTTGVDADAFAMLEAFSADAGDGLHEQRQAAWNYAVNNPAAEGGVWGQFWGNAHFGAAGTEAMPTPAPTPEPTPTPIPTWPNVPNPGLTSTFTDSRGILWRVLANSGNATLIMTEYVYGVGMQYNTTNVYTRLTQSNLRTVLNLWGGANLAPELVARARTPDNVDNDVRQGNTAGFNAWSTTENESAGWTSPGAAAANAPGALFVLSISEVNRYAATVGTTNAARVARDMAGVAHNWWLRSPGLYPNNNNVATVARGGDLGVRPANIMQPDPGTGAGFRPALWITRP